MIKEYQVTLKCASGKYRPVSCIVKCEELNLNDKSDRKILIAKGTQKICAKRYWDKRDLLKNEYTKAIVREYDKEKIQKENAERYERIKQEKKATGEWK